MHALIQLSCGFVRQVAALQRTNATLLQKLDASVAEIARLRKGGGGDVVVKELSGNPAGWCALCRRSRHSPPTSTRTMVGCSATAVVEGRAGCDRCPLRIVLEAVFGADIFCYLYFAPINGDAHHSILQRG